MAAIRLRNLVVGLSMLLAPHVAWAQAKQDEPRAIARWSGTIEEKKAAGFVAAVTDLFGYLISPPGYAYEMKASVNFREEMTDKGGIQYVVENLAWFASEKDLHYLGRDDGVRVGAGKGGQGGKSYSEEELAGPLIPTDPQTLEAARQRVKQAQADRAAAEKSFNAAKGKKDQAEKERNAAKADQNTDGKKKAFDSAQANYEKVFSDDTATVQQKRDATAELTRTRNEYFDSLGASADVLSGLAAKEVALAQAESVMADAKRTLDHADHNLHGAQAELARLERGNRRPLANVTVTYEEKSRKSGKVHVAMNFSPMEHIAVDVIPMDQIMGEGAGRTVLARIGKRLAVVLSNNSKIQQRHVQIPPIPSSNAVGTVSGETATATYEYKQGGRQVKIRFERRGIKNEKSLIVKGQVIHRIRVPQSPSELNIFRADSVGKLDGKLSVQGKVRVEAWLTDANTPPPSAGGPPGGKLLGITQSALGGEFKLSFPEPAANKNLRLRFIYHSAAAQLMEINTVDVATDDVLSAIRSGTMNQEVAGVRRRGECQVRWDRLPNGKIIELGEETRPCVLRKVGSDYALDFLGANSILINTLCLKAPYVSQEFNPYKLNTIVPNQRLLKAIPPWWSEKQQAVVKNRLPGKGAEALGRMDTDVLGSIVCYPTCLTMALGCLKEITVEGLPCDKTRELAQGIYELYYESHKAAAPQQWPFQFPFYDDPKTAFQGLQIPIAGRPFPIPEPLRHALIERRLTVWPFVEANQTYTGNNIRWMCTVPDIGFRPWQISEYVKNYLEHALPNGFAMKCSNPEEADLFHGAHDQQIINALGRGCPAIASIKHLDDGGLDSLGPDNRLVKSVSPGGHILCLLGAVIDNQGVIKRLIFHDPYGDQSQNPTQPGYYDPSGKRIRDDVDRFAGGKQPRNIGAYVPYGPDIISFIELFDEKGNMVGPGTKAGKLTQVGGINTKWWMVLTRSDEKAIQPAQWQSALPSPVQGRLLPSGQ